MDQPILHIGFPKTGTTWFFDSFYQKIPNVYIPHPNTYLSEIAKPDFIFPEYDSSKRLILLHPDLTGVKRFIWDDGLQREKIAKNLYRNFPKATIIIFIRNQIDFLTSVYLYYVRKGGTLTGEMIIDLMIKKELKFTLDYLKYNETIQVYQTLFGKEHTHVYLYEDFCKDSLAFITNYSKQYGFDVSPDKINFTPKNEKLRMRLMKVLLFTNKLTKHDNPFKKHLVHIPFLYKLINENVPTWNKMKLMGKKAKTNDLFNEEQIAYITNYYKSSNKELETLFNLDKLKEFNYPL